MAKRRAPSSKGLIIVILLIASIVTAAVLMTRAFFSPASQAKGVVEQFYKYEADGDFSASWALFHSSMKEKFSKGNYIQDRAHVFMNHFGVETFTYTIGKPEEVKKWKMSKTGPALKNVYKVLVTQTYKGKYGNFDIEQEVFVVQEKGEWRVMWDYNQ
jgi:hypothetical protein